MPRREQLLSEGYGYVLSNWHCTIRRAAPVHLGPTAQATGSFCAAMADRSRPATAGPRGSPGQFALPDGVPRARCRQRRPQPPTRLRHGWPSRLCTAGAEAAARGGPRRHRYFSPQGRLKRHGRKATPRPARASRTAGKRGLRRLYSPGPGRGRATASRSVLARRRRVWTASRPLRLPGLAPLPRPAPIGCAARTRGGCCTARRLRVSSGRAGGVGVPGAGPGGGVAPRPRSAPSPVDPPGCGGRRPADGGCARARKRCCLHPSPVSLPRLPPPCPPRVRGLCGPVAWISTSAGVAEGLRVRVARLGVHATASLLVINCKPMPWKVFVGSWGNCTVLYWKPFRVPCVGNMAVLKGQVQRMLVGFF